MVKVKFLWQFRSKIIILIISNMRWTVNEQKTLIQIRQKFGRNCWEKIADQLNCKIKQRVRTGRQCRDKYINISKLDLSKDRKEVNWSTNDQTLLHRLYISQGSCWNNFIDQFPKKSINNLRNKFYNKLRKFHRKLADFQSIYFKDCRNQLSYHNIVSLLDLSSQLKQWISESGYKENQNSIIISNRNKMAELIFENVKFENVAYVNQVFIQIKQLNKKLKCLGIFKNITKKRLWKLTQTRLRFILSIDNLIQNQNEVLKQKKLIKQSVDQSLSLIPNANQFMVKKQVVETQQKNLINFPNQINEKNTVKQQFAGNQGENLTNLIPKYQNIQPLIYFYGWHENPFLNSYY